MSRVAVFALGLALLAIAVQSIPQYDGDFSQLGWQNTPDAEQDIDYDQYPRSRRFISSITGGVKKFWNNIKAGYNDKRYQNETTTTAAPTDAPTTVRADNGYAAGNGYPYQGNGYPANAGFYGNPQNNAYPGYQGAGYQGYGYPGWGNQVNAYPPNNRF